MPPSRMRGRREWGKYFRKRSVDDGQRFWRGVCSKGRDNFSEWRRRNFMEKIVIVILDKFLHQMNVFWLQLK